MFVKPKLIAFTLIILFAATAVSILYVTSTQKGARLVVRVFLSKCLQFNDIQFGEAEGSFLTGLKLRDVEIRDPKELPKGTVIWMDEIRFAALLSHARGWLSFKIHHLKYKSPDFDRVLFFRKAVGRPFGGLWLSGFRWAGSSDPEEGNRVNIKNLNALFSNGKEPIVGELQFRKLDTNGFTLLNCDASFRVTQNVKNGKGLWRGELSVRRGTILWKDRVIKLRPGTISWSGDPAEPSFDLKGISVIGDIVIALTLKGMKNALDLKLHSDAPVSQKRLFLMFWMGKSWTNIFLTPFIRVSHA